MPPIRRDEVAKIGMKRRRECGDEREVGDQQRKFVRNAQRFTLVDQRWQRAPAAADVVGWRIRQEPRARRRSNTLAPIRGAPIHLAMEARNRRLAQPDSAVSRPAVAQVEVVVLDRNSGEVGGSRWLAKRPISSTMALRFSLSMSR